MSCIQDESNEFDLMMAKMRQFLSYKHPKTDSKNCEKFQYHHLLELELDLENFDQLSHG